MLPDGHLLADDGVMGRPLSLCTGDGDGMLHVGAGRVTCVVAVHDRVGPVLDGLTVALNVPQLRRVVHDVMDVLVLDHGARSLVLRVRVRVRVGGSGSGRPVHRCCWMVSVVMVVMGDGDRANSREAGVAGRGSKIRLLVDDDDLGRLGTLLRLARLLGLLL